MCGKQPRKGEQERFTAILHHLNIALLRDSFYALKRQAAPGVDGVTWSEYETGLEDRLSPPRTLQILSPLIFGEHALELYQQLILWRDHRGSPAVPESIPGTAGEVRTGITSGEDATDRVRAVRRSQPAATWRGKAETFTFLGFTHYCGKRRSNGAFIVWRKTAKKRMVAKLCAIKAELRRRRHEPVRSVGEWLKKVVTGYYRYHAVPGNLDRLRIFGHRLARLWWRILSRRSHRGDVSWDRLTPTFEKSIPVPRVLHPYPTERFLASHPRWEPYALWGLQNYVAPSLQAPVESSRQ